MFNNKLEQRFDICLFRSLTVFKIEFLVCFIDHALIFRLGQQLGKEKNLETSGSKSLKRA